MEDRVFDDEIKSFDDIQTTKKCPTCGADLESDAQFCPYCGAQIGESVKTQEVQEDAPKKPLAPRPLKKGEKVRHSATPTKEYKYGDGYSISSLSLFTLYASWAIPLVTLIVALLGLTTKNPKDKKLFKIGIILSVVFLIVQVVLIVLQATGTVDFNRL